MGPEALALASGLITVIGRASEGLMKLKALSDTAEFEGREISAEELDALRIDREEAFDALRELSK